MCTWFGIHVKHYVMCCVEMVSLVVEGCASNEIHFYFYFRLDFKLRISKRRRQILRDFDRSTGFSNERTRGIDLENW